MYLSTYPSNLQNIQKRHLATKCFTYFYVPTQYLFPLCRGKYTKVYLVADEVVVHSQRCCKGFPMNGALVAAGLYIHVYNLEKSWLLKLVPEGKSTLKLVVCQLLLAGLLDLGQRPKVSRRRTRRRRRTSILFLSVANTWFMTSCNSSLFGVCTAQDPQT